MRTAALKFDRASFELQWVSTDGNRMVCQALLALSDPLAPRFPAIPCWLKRQDVLRLIDYLRGHVANLAGRVIEPKDWEYVPGKLEFYVRALSGISESYGSGYFSIQFMLNVSAPTLPGLYVGAEAMVQVEDALGWCEQLESWVGSIVAEI